ncbi:Gfo/Idh/MocA family oxidoreductase [Lachnospiraceae bacterium ASD3451]|uniref:Gfo/Idh/MocA family protein n=1 Tax=Diplocloster agilis TaxID=2850323 RepID=UPI001D3E343E|nr:Gfo/Idh/MocA family oxidoreductase [Diplocloster agilis]MBU9745234.1 Gfo/Idh/MocA family oxidoreductase [Diplocloster agilis]
MERENMRSVRTAVVGCGMISDIYLKNCRDLFSILEVVGCCDIREDAAKQKAREYGIRSMTLEEIMEDTSIEVVINLTAPAAHYEVIRRLLQSGKHVYTEKVLALELDEAKELAALADKNHVYLGAAPDTFLGSALQTGRFILDSGMIGEPTGCLALLNRDNRVGAEFIPYIARMGGGIGFDVGIYYMTALLSLMGPVKEVSGFMDTREPMRTHRYPNRSGFGEPYQVECENLMAGALHFQDGAMGTVLFNSECIMNRYPELTIFGTQGILYLPDPDGFGGEVKVLRRGSREPAAIQQNHGFEENSRGLGAAEMAWALRKGRVPRAGKEMAVHSLEALHGIAESARTKRAYSMTTDFYRPKPLPQGYLRRSDFADFEADEEAALAVDGGGLEDEGKALAADDAGLTNETKTLSLGDNGSVAKEIRR